MQHDDRDRSHLLLPLFVASALLLAVNPLLHPVGTCTDWLEKWGEASHHKSWVWIHELAMIGFALLGAAGGFYPLLTPRSRLAIAGGGAMAAGGIIAALSILIHATSASSLGRAYMAASSQMEKKILRTVAEAVVSYDIGAASASSLLISAGCSLLVASLIARRVLTLLPALFLGGLGLVWTFQYHGVFNRLGFSIPETIHWASLSLWLAAFGLLGVLRNRRISGTSRAEKSAAVPAAT